MARKYGKTIKLAEHRNKRTLNILGSPTGTEKEQPRLQIERHLNRFKIRSSIPPSLLSPVPGGPAQLKGSTAGVPQLTLTQGAWNIPAGASLGDGRAAQVCPLPHTSLPGGFLYCVIATPPLPPWTLAVTSQWARKYKTDSRSHSRLSGQVIHFHGDGNWQSPKTYDPRPHRPEGPDHPQPEPPRNGCPRRQG